MQWTLMGMLRAVLLLAVPVAAQGTTPTTEPGPAGAAQTAEPQERGVSAATLRELVEKISDPEARERLLEQLRALIAAIEQEPEAPSEPGPLDGLSSFFEEMSQSLGETASRLLTVLAELPAEARALGDRVQDPDERQALLVAVGKVAGVIAAALLGAGILWFGLRRVRLRLRQVRSSRSPGPLLRVSRTLLRLGVDLLIPAAALAIVSVCLSVLPLTHDGAAVVLAVVWAFALHRAGRALIRALLAPDEPRLRLVPLSDDTSKKLTKSLSRALALAVYGYFAVALARAVGAAPRVVDPLTNLYALALLITAIAVILKYRRRLGAGARAADGDVAGPPTPGDGEPEQDLLDPGDGALEKPSFWRNLGHSALGIWWVAALIYVIGIYALWLSGVKDGFTTALHATLLTIVWVAAAMVVISLERGLMRRIASRLRSWADDLSARVHVRRYVLIVRTAIEIAIVVFALGLVLEAWGVDALDSLLSETVSSIVAELLGLLLIVLLALAISDATTTLAQSYLERKQQESADTAKIATLVPLANKVIRLTVVVIATLMILSQLGVAIGPILASVGFLGLAIGFGAQTLVKDVISGVFNLVEDNVSTGHVVKIGAISGLVESINIRTIQLRDLSGNLHTVPWGQVDILTNYTKEYGRYLIDCGVAYREDVDEVIRVLRDLGAEMQQDPEFGPKILEPIEILGVDRFEDSAVVIRARLKTEPREQWGVGREFNRRMKKRFDELGIEIPFPHRTLYVGEDKDGGSPPLRVLNEGGSSPPGDAS